MFDLVVAAIEHDAPVKGLCKQLTVEKLIPNFIEKGYMHLPDIITYKHNITVKEDFSTEVDNLYVAGESAAISGLYSAALSGIIAASTI